MLRYLICSIICLLTFSSFGQSQYEISYWGRKNTISPKIVLQNSEILSYNGEGLLVQKQCFDSKSRQYAVTLYFYTNNLLTNAQTDDNSGLISSESTHTFYDKTGHKQKEIKIQNPHRFFDSTILYYDTKGLLISESKFYWNKTDKYTEDRTIFHYDTEGRIAQKEWYRFTSIKPKEARDPYMAWAYRHKFNDGQHTIKEYRIKNNKKHKLKWLKTSTYNDKGDLIFEKEGERKTTYIYEYDDKGVWKTKTEWVQENILSIPKMILETKKTRIK